MSDTKKNTWLNYLSISMIVMAVIASVSAYYAGYFSAQSIMNQSKAANNWAYYQAKSTKEYLFTIEQKFLLVRNQATKDTAVIRKINELLQESERQTSRYEKEKKAIAEEAIQFETQRDHYWSKYLPLGIVLVFMQVGLLFSSIAGLFKRKFEWYIGLISLVTGILYLVYTVFI